MAHKSGSKKMRSSKDDIFNREFHENNQENIQNTSGNRFFLIITLIE